MDVQLGPNPVDEPNLLYKLQRKIKVFGTNDPLPNRGYNLVANSSKYGLVFVGVPEGILTVYQLSQLVDKECEPQHVTVQLQEKPTHVAVSCDDELVAVTGGQLLCVYKVADFQNSNVSPSVSIKTEVSPSTFVSALQWNPCIPDSIAIAYYDCTLIACLVSSGQMKKVPSKARCICWSPKGKQLVTGNCDGTLIQYKPDLTPAKLVPAPNLFEGSPVEAIAIYWIATFQFAVVYRNASDNSRPAVTIVNTPKAGQPSCLSYEDICYSMGSNRPWYYYLQGLAQWNIIMTSSSNSMEIGTLGSADGANWMQWCQTDEARPELPLTNKKIENYPVGISIDTCAIHQLPWGENETLPHMPLLHVISQNGLLTTFNVINLKKEAVQVCSPPQQLALPAHAMSSVIPGEAPAQPASAPAPAPAPKPEPEAPIQQAYSTAAASIPQPAPEYSSVTTNVTIKIPNFTPQSNLAFTAAPVNKVPEEKPVQETKPVAVSQPQASVAQPKPQQVSAPKPQQAPTPKPQPTPQQTQENAALKAEQDRMNKMKANQELKNMLVKEVNDFQMELYNFMVKTRETQARLQRDIETISTNFNGMSLDTEQLKKECSIEELRGAIVQLKLELVRACAVVAEARTHSDAKDLPQWTQADPLTSKRVASVKKLAYYVQNQLEQAHRALDYKWNEVASNNPEFNKPGKRMIRPILDDVYQPLVKQQEILSRQQVVLRTLKNALNECDIGPVFKSTSILRSTPFRNNKDPLSKLTKNILNMSIDPETKPKRTFLTAQKLDALRDVLSNHKTIKIKPVNVELRQHLATMRKNYEKCMMEKAQQSQYAQVKTEPEIESQVQPAPQTVVVKIEPKQEQIKQTMSVPETVPASLAVPKPETLPVSMTVAVPVSIAVPMPMPVPDAVPVSLPVFTPVISNIKSVAPERMNVARTLFTDEPKQEPSKPQPTVQRPLSKPFGFSTPTTVAESPVDTKSVLKDILTNKQANLEAKNSNNTFMGQKICSPTAFAQSSAPTSVAAPSAVFTSKPIADINNMLSKIQPQPFVPESKSTLNAKTTEKPKSSSSDTPNVKSSETGEPEETVDVPKPLDLKPKDKPITNLFAMNKTPVAASSPISPEASKTSVQEQKAKTKITVKSLDKMTEEIKENIPEKDSENVSKTVQKVAEKKETLKPLSTQISNKSIVFTESQASETADVTATPSEQKPLDLKSEVKTESSNVLEKSDVSSTASSIFSSANASTPASKPQSAFTPTSTIATTETLTANSTESESKLADLTVTKASTLASSIFGAAVSSQPKTTSSIFSSSTGVFSSTPSSETSVFGTTNVSIFSISKPTSGTATTASSIFGQTNTTQSVFSSTAASVFASASSSQPSTPTTAPLEFEATTTAASIFGTSSTVATSVFGTTTSTSEFEIDATSTPDSAAPSTVSSVFGATTTASIASVFGTTPTTQTAVFGSTETSPNAFTPTTTSIFVTATTQASVFGQAAQSIFGVTTQGSLFGGTATQPSVFGSPSTQTSVFGSLTPTTQASVFGTHTQTSQASIFGTPTPATQASVFGTPTQASQTSVFGTPTQTTQTSVFGTPTQTTQASIFGQPETNSQGGLFGGGEGNLFASASISTTSAPTAGSGGNIFGGSSPGTVFGSGNTNVFGGKSTFGQSNQTGANIFGGGTSFGQKPATNFWGSSGNSTGGGFGSSGFGQPATTQASSIFGGTTGGSFSQPSAGAFGSPQQPSFGSPQQQQQATGFGGSPVFGSKPVFGQSTGFGSSGGGFGAPAAFGGFNKSPNSGGFGAPAFGGGTGFGGGATGGGFGTPTQSNATFESLATQNTLTFGNLAQQSPPAQQAAPTFNTSPAFTGWRG